MSKIGETRVWRDAQRRTRERYWSDVDRLFSALPPFLFRHAKLLQYDLALRYSETGRFRDVLLEVHHFPLLSVASWLLDDLALPDGPERYRVERHLFLAAVLSLATAHTVQNIRDESSFYDGRQLPLALFLADRTVSQFARVIPFPSSFWDRYAALWPEHLEGVLRTQDRDRGSTAAEDPEDFLPANHWSAPAKLLAAAAALCAHQEALVPDLATMLDELAAASLIRADLITIHRDLRRGLITYPIAMIARSAGIALHPPPRAAEVLGAMVVTDSLDAICDAARARLAASRRTSADLGLATFTSYLRDAEVLFENMQRGLSKSAVAPGKGTPAVLGPTRPLFVIDEPPLPKSLDMAEGFLLSDPTFRESWELHREGMFDEAEVASRFPAGVILEILSSHGHDLAKHVEKFLAFAARNRFRYYAHVASGVDSDTLGVFLRLQPYARERRKQAKSLEAILGCMERSIGPDGVIPVWLTRCDGDLSASRPRVVALGEGCATVEAHLLIGLSDFAFERYRSVIETSAGRLFERVRRLGLGANVNYPPLYALGIYFRLLSALERRQIGPDLRTLLSESRKDLVTELEAATGLAGITAQDAALLALACFHAGADELLDPRWITITLKRQRFDGGWSGEPFAPAPNRGRSVTWYTSAMLTTALCYDALKRYARWVEHKSGQADA